MISHAIISGYYSWRNTAAGSWFIQSLVHILESQTDVASRDVLSLLTLINRRVTKEYESNSSRSEFNHKKQTPFFYSTHEPLNLPGRKARSKNFKTPLFSRYQKFLPLGSSYGSRTLPKNFSQKNLNKYGRQRCQKFWHTRGRHQHTD